MCFEAFLSDSDGYHMHICMQPPLNKSCFSCRNRNGKLNGPKSLPLSYRYHSTDTHNRFMYTCTRGKSTMEIEKCEERQNKDFYHTSKRHKHTSVWISWIQQQLLNSGKSKYIGHTLIEHWHKHTQSYTLTRTLAYSFKYGHFVLSSARWWGR